MPAAERGIRAIDGLEHGPREGRELGVRLEDGLERSDGELGVRHEVRFGEVRRALLRKRLDHLFGRLHGLDGSQRLRPLRAVRVLVVRGDHGGDRVEPHVGEEERARYALWLLLREARDGGRVAEHLKELRRVVVPDVGRLAGEERVGVLPRPLGAVERMREHDAHGKAHGGEGRLDEGRDLVTLLGGRLGPVPP